MSALQDLRARRGDIVASLDAVTRPAADAKRNFTADEEQLQSTLDALIENAVKFTRDDDRIAIVGRNDGSTAVIEVSDTGNGIPPDQLTLIFDRFSRLDEGRRRGNGGTGLGLAIVKAIVEAHGGSVRVRSELGEGTTFSLFIPGFKSGPNGVRSGAWEPDVHEAPRA